MRTKSIDMLSSSLWKSIILYSVPLMFSNVLQVLFNMADVMVVGRFSGPLALGSVGSTTMIIQLETGILFGLSTGICAIVAFHTGAKEKDGVVKAIHTSVLLSVILGVSLLIIGILSARSFLSLLKTKDELIIEATLYLRIYFLGVPALSLYNCGNAILTANGETKRPLLYLLLSGVVNVLLNLLFVIVFKLSVLGVALASVISQYLSAFLILRYLICTDTDYRIVPHLIKYDRILSKEILRIASPCACQHALFSLSNLFVQASINYFPHYVVEGCAAGGNSDPLVYDMMAAFYTASTGFISQNLGAGKIDRIKTTYIVTTVYSFILGLVLGGLLVIFRREFIMLFTSHEEVIKYGEIRVMIMGASYCISAFMDNATAASRGCGKTIGPTVIIVMGTIVFRIIWIFTVFRYFHTLESLFLLYVSSWVLTAICANIYFCYSYKKIKKMHSYKLA